MSMLVQVITGTTRAERFSESVSAWVLDHLRHRDDVISESVDLRDHPLPFFDAAPPARNPRDYPTAEIARLGAALDRADAYVVVTGEYNHGYPAVLKNAMDWTFVEWGRKPVTFVGWGNAGGARCIEQLRQVAVEFEMAPLRHAVHILPETMAAVRQADDTSRLAAFTALEPRLKILTDELIWWAEALRAARLHDQP
jgi:NAD(P)H-dependent FMN reductase